MVMFDSAEYDGEYAEYVPEDDQYHPVDPNREQLVIRWEDFDFTDLGSVADLRIRTNRNADDLPKEYYYRIRQADISRLVPNEEGFERQDRHTIGWYRRRLRSEMSKMHNKKMTKETERLLFCLCGWESDKWTRNWQTLTTIWNKHLKEVA